MNKVVVEPSGYGGTEITRFNAMKHGVLSRFTVLPICATARIRTSIESEWVVKDSNLRPTD